LVTGDPARACVAASLSRCPAAAVSTAALDGVQDAPDIAGHLLDAGIAFPDLASVFVNLVVVPGDDLGQISDDACYDPDLASKIVNARSNLGELRSHLRELSGGRIHVGTKYPRETFQRQLTISVCQLVFHQSRPDSQRNRFWTGSTSCAGSPRCRRRSSEWFSPQLVEGPHPIADRVSRNLQWDRSWSNSRLSLALEQVPDLGKQFLILGQRWRGRCGLLFLYTQDPAEELDDEKKHGEGDQEEVDDFPDE
jgi:hypothetical protein